MRFGLTLAASTSLLAAVALVSLDAHAVPPKSVPPPVSGPQAAAPVDVDTAEALYAKLDYEGANSVAERVVRQKGLTHDHLVRAYRVLAVTYAVLDREEEAQKAFLQLLTYDPDYQADPNLGPKVNQPFVEARGSFRTLAAKPGIEVVATVQTTGGTLRVTTRDPTKIVRKVSVGYRWTSSGEYTVQQIAAGDSGNVEVSAAPAGRTRLDFYAQALDDRENAVLEAGNPQVPKSAFAEPGSRGGGGGGAKKEEGGSILSSPFFWIFAGAAVAGGGTALFFALRPQDPPTKATLSPVIQCGGDRCN